MATNRKMIHIYATGDEKAEIEKRAKDSGKSVSKYLLELATSSSEVEVKRIRVSKPDRTQDNVKVPPPSSDGVERGFFVHPAKKR